MFKKLSLAQLFVLQAAVAAQYTYLSNQIAEGTVPTDSTDANVRAEALVKLGNDFAIARDLGTSIATSIDDKQVAAKTKADAKASKKNAA